MMARSTPASSIRASTVAASSDSPCAFAREGHGRSGVLAPQMWTCESTMRNA